MSTASRPTVRVIQANLLLSRQNLAERYRHFIEAIAGSPADIIFMQEVSDLPRLEWLLAEAGYGFVAASLPIRKAGAPTQHVVIASRHRISRLPAGIGSVPSAEHGTWHGCRVHVGDLVVNVFTAHAAWGPFGEGARLMLAHAVEQAAARLEADTPGSLSVLAGDLNCLPESRTIRYLTGFDLAPDGSSTCWTDAFDIAGTPDQWATTEHAINELGKGTAKSVGIERTDELPARRVDYILARGWVFGRTGYPATFERIAHPDGLEFTDHHVIAAELMR